VVKLFILGIRNKNFERSCIFRNGLPKDILSKGQKTTAAAALEA